MTESLQHNNSNGPAAARRQSADLPWPVRDRWQPLRGGLLNLYRYDYEEFHYEDGHLLLRGNNGTGKSRVLALQLPFLLDGEVAPHRVEPDADIAKRMEWNLLLGKYPERLGYTWIEFGRRDDDGEAHYLTLGCGLSAVAGRGLVGKWFFITKRRIGQELFLQAPGGQALTRERLVEELGPEGEVFTVARDYRRAVDRALFQLGEHRYNALMDLLIQLRQPQLSRQLDEQKLSRALSEALPPLSEMVLGDIAESFRSLEADRLALDRLMAAHRHVERFIGTYRQYAQIAARRRAERVSVTQHAYQSALHRLQEAERRREQARLELADSARQLEQLAIEQQAAETAVQTLADSPQMRDAKSLDLARQMAESRRADAERARQEFEQASSRQNLLERLLLEAQRAEEAAEAECRLREIQALEMSRTAGLEESLLRGKEALTSVLRDAGDEVDAQLAAIRRTLDDATALRRRGARHIATFQQQIDEARHALAAAREMQASLADQADAAVSRQHEHEATLAQTRETLIRDYSAWFESLRELDPASPEEIAEAVNVWCDSGSGPSPVASAVRNAAAIATRNLLAPRIACERQVELADAEIAALQKDRAEIAAGGGVPPISAPTRDHQQRAGRPGAALWQLCDFAPDVPDASRAGIEAALEAAGLLDAWVSPTGMLLDGITHDVVLVADDLASLPAEHSLAAVLVPAVDRTNPQAALVSEETIRAILQRIGYGSGAGTVWIDPEGHWQLGPLRGHWSKPAAQHLGAGARDADRRKRLDSLDSRLAEVQHRRERLIAELETLTAREQAVQREVESAPDDTAVRDALAQAGAAIVLAEDLRTRISNIEQQVAERRNRLEELIAERDRAAEDLGIAPWVERLPAIEDALRDYERAVAEWWPALRLLVTARRAATVARENLAEAAAETERRAGQHQSARAEAESAAAVYRTLQESVGVAVEEVLERLNTARQHASRLREQIAAQRKSSENARVESAVAEQQIEDYSEQLSVAIHERDQAAADLKELQHAGLLSLVLVESAPRDETTESDPLHVAESLLAALQSVNGDEESWTRQQTGIHRHIQELTEALLPLGHQVATLVHGDLFRVSIEQPDQSRTPLEFAAALLDEIEFRQSLLNAEEREILENHLIGEMATHLRELLIGAEELVRQMNAELQSRPTSTGMTLRFTWRPISNGPTGLADARRRLLATEGIWSTEDRALLGQFLQQQIQAVREANDVGTWQEHLAAALDYRRWHEFGIERQQDGQWKRLTRRTHGTGSGGEKAIALTIPQFAAAAAHYASADRHAPRLILLDEAFVGVDADMRSKCMGLLTAFDLDFVMTSEREWGCYATLPGLAIYQLSTRPGIDAVHVTRWVWNGRERRQSPQVLPSPSKPERESPAVAAAIDPHLRKTPR